MLVCFFSPPRSLTPSSGHRCNYRRESAPGTDVLGVTDVTIFVLVRFNEHAIHHVCKTGHKEKKKNMSRIIYWMESIECIASHWESPWIDGQSHQTCSCFFFKRRFCNNHPADFIIIIILVSFYWNKDARNECGQLWGWSRHAVPPVTARWRARARGRRTAKHIKRMFGNQMVISGACDYWFPNHKHNPMKNKLNRIRITEAGDDWAARNRPAVNKKRLEGPERKHPTAFPNSIYSGNVSVGFMRGQPWVRWGIYREERPQVVCVSTARWCSAPDSPSQSAGLCFISAINHLIALISRQPFPVRLGEVGGMGYRSDR